MIPNQPQLLCYYYYHLTITIPITIFLLCSQSQSQPFNPPFTEGFTCNPNQSTNYPCQAYALYRPNPPNYLDLASIGDLFSLSRLMISRPTNISDPSAPLNPTQQLFVPLTCSCNTINSTFSISSANLNYTIKSGDTFWYVSTDHFQNLTTYQSVEAVNPGIIPTKLEVGDNVVFPIFCKCPDQTQKSNRVNFMVSYVFQPSDYLSRVAATFRVTQKSISDANGNQISPLNTIFIPVNRLPVLAQRNSTTNSTPPSVRTERKGLIRGLAAGVGVCGVLLAMVIACWVYREKSFKKEAAGKWRDEEKQRKEFYMAGGGGKGIKEMEASLMADVSECLDKYRVFKMDELREATDGFSEHSLIEGSVFKAQIDGVQYAIKKMKWNAREELKILQKVNHGNLVQLEGFCIDPQEANCYLVYEYIENGSLQSWLHTDKSRELSWKSRVRIAIDVANGLQYIHEHTRPRVVHKDIKSTNILLDSNMRAKIANFGLAKSGCNAITMHIVGTQGYIAPEYLADGVVSTKMDVFAFGVVLLELVSGKEAFDEDGTVLWGEVARVVMEGGGSPEGRKVEKVRSWVDEALAEETYSIESVVNVMTVAAACVHRDPAKRPSMVDVVYALCRSDELFFDVSNEGLSNPTVIAR
ncbi:Serine/threonine receptor-like kinase NFP [Linum grandiflorum]